LAQNKHVEALEIATGEADITKNMLYKANKKSHTQLHNKVRKDMDQGQKRKGYYSEGS
jgi:hypothetical protein